MSMQDDEAETYYVPGSPMALIVIGAVLAAVGTAVLVAADATGARAAGAVALGVGGIVAQIGVIAAGVEYALRRAESRTAHSQPV